MPTTLDEAVAVAHQVDIERPEPPASEPGQEWWCPIPEATLFDLNSGIGSLEASLDLDECECSPWSPRALHWGATTILTTSSSQ